MPFDFFRLMSLPNAILCRLISATFCKWSFSQCGHGVVIGLGVSVGCPQRICLEDNVRICGPGTIMAISNHHGYAYDGCIKIGSNVYIGKYCHITAAKSITIGIGTCIANNVHITDCNHGFTDLDCPILLQPLSDIEPTIVGKYCFLGHNVNVLHGVTIGDHCVIGANAVVTSDIPNYCMAVGIPAKIIKRYNPVTKTWEKSI